MLASNAAETSVAVEDDAYPSHNPSHSTMYYNQVVLATNVAETSVTLDVFPSHYPSHYAIYNIILYMI